MRLFDKLTHYQVLEIEPGATSEEIHSAYLRVREIWSTDSLASYSLYTPAERKAILRSIEESYHLLMDEQSRREYDHQLFEEQLRQEDQEAKRSGKVQRDLPFNYPYVDEQTLEDYSIPGATGTDLGTSPAGRSPKPPDPPTEISGPAIRAYRETLGISIEEVSLKTRVRKPIIKAIEAEDAANLPAPVFLKGFLQAYFKLLGLDSPNDAAVQYLQRCNLNQD